MPIFECSVPLIEPEEIETKPKEVKAEFSET